MQGEEEKTSQFMVPNGDLAKHLEGLWVSPVELKAFGGTFPSVGTENLYHKIEITKTEAMETTINWQTGYSYKGFKFKFPVTILATSGITKDKLVQSPQCQGYFYYQFSMFYAVWTEEDEVKTFVYRLIDKNTISVSGTVVGEGTGEVHLGNMCRVLPEVYPESIPYNPLYKKPGGSAPSPTDTE